MAIQTINIGTTPNDGTGDPARTAFIKINDNFTQPENAASRLVATPAEALSGTAGVLTDAAGVKAHVDSRVTQSTTDATAGRLLKVGDFGVTNWALDGTSLAASADSFPRGTIALASTSSMSGLPSLSGSYIVSTYGNLGLTSAIWQTALHRESATLFTRTVNEVGWLASLNTGNTTVDPNGFIKQASPIVSLYRDRAESNGSAELEEMQFERISTGHYRLTGVPELSRDGWYIETPKDRNGNIYFTIDYDESVEGELTIRTYEPDYSTGRATNGDPVDIIDGRFVSLRFIEIPELHPTPDAAETEEA